MTIFHFRIVTVAALLTSCGLTSRAPDSDLDRIKRMSNFELASSELQKFTDARLGKPEEMRREFEAAGFKHSASPDENDPGCEFYRWTKQDTRSPVVMTANICNGEASASAGVPNP